MPSSKKKFSSDEVESWSTEEVTQWLVSVKLEAFKEFFEQQEMTGISLLQMTGDDIKAMNCTDKRKKAMKKALSSLPGNSVSSKGKPKKPRKQGSDKNPPPPAPPLPANGPPPLPQSNPPSGPPLPAGSSRPSVHRGHLPPPPPLEGEDYEDPVLSAPSGPVWGDGIPEEDGYGEPTDIYDCVDEMDLPSENQPHPPPLPPQGNGFHGAPPPPSYPPGYEDDDENIYDEGEVPGDDQGSFSDSFSSEAESDEDDYLSPYEENPETIPKEPEVRERGESNAIRTLKGRFFAAGLTKHTGINISGSSPSSPKGSARDIPPPNPPGDEEEGEFDEIYDAVPDELKQQFMMEEGEEPDDIYDIPPDMVEPPPLVLPPKPKVQKPPLPVSVTPTPSSVPDPYGEGEDDIYEGGDEEEEDLYDIPSEVEQKAMDKAGKLPPLPPPPSNPPAEAEEVMPPFDEDIYDIADLDPEPQPSPALPARPMEPHLLPARPPKSGDASPAPLISRSNKPSSTPSGSPAISRSPFNNRPAMKKQIDTSSPSAVPLPPRPPKSESSKPPLPAEPHPPPLPPPAESPLPPRPPPAEPHLPPRPPPAEPSLPPRPPPTEPHPPPPPLPPPAEPHPPPLPPPANSFQRPPLMAPIDAAGPPPPRPPSETKPSNRNKSDGMEERLAKLSPGSKRVPPPSSPKMSPKFGRKPAEKKELAAPPVVPSEPKPVNGKSPMAKGMGSNTSVPVNPEPTISVSKPSVNGTSKPFHGQKPTSSAVNKPGGAASRISNLMNRFEKAPPESNGDSAGSSGPSPLTSPNHNVLAAPSKPDADISPLSGRRMLRKQSVEDLTKKFGGSTRSPSPDFKPSLPKKPGIVVSKVGNAGGDSVPKPWAKKPAENQSDGSKPPWGRKADGESLPAKPSWSKKAEPSGNSLPAKPQPPWAKKAETKPDEALPTKPSWAKKSDGKPSDESPTWMRKQVGDPPPKPSWAKKPSEKAATEQPPAKPWMKKQNAKPAEEKDEQPSTAPPAKPWMKKQAAKPPSDDAPAPPVPPTTAKPWVKKQQGKTPAKPSDDEAPNTPPPTKSWMRKPLPKPSDQDEPPSLPPPLKPSLNKPGGKSKPPEPAEDSPEEIEEEPPPPRRPPTSAFPKVPDSSPGAGKIPPSQVGILRDKPPVEEAVPKKVFSYKPYNPKEHTTTNTSATSPRNQSPTPEEPIPPRLPGRAPEEPPSLPGRNPPPAYRAPPEPSENSPPNLPGRILPPPIRVPPAESENTPPSLPGRLPPPTQRAPPEPQSPPNLPSRNPPSHRPSDPPLPPRPGQPVHSEPAVPLPERSWKPPELPSPRQPPELPSPRLPPDLPSSRPPDIPSKRLPEPLPAEPTLQPRNVPIGSPAGQVWYHGNLDRKRSEALLKHYSKDGTFIIRDSTRVAGEYSLSLWYGGAVRHLRIRIKPDKKFVLGEEKSDECVFETIMDLVTYHRQKAIKLKSGGEATLKYECPK